MTGNKTRLQNLSDVLLCFMYVEVYVQNVLITWYRWFLSVFLTMSFTIPLPICYPVHTHTYTHTHTHEHTHTRTHTRTHTHEHTHTNTHTHTYTHTHAQTKCRCCRTEGRAVSLLYTQGTDRAHRDPLECAPSLRDDTSMTRTWH